MGYFRFQKRVKLLPGVSVNLSKSGASLTVGTPGAKVTVGPKGSHAHAGIPGTGVSYHQKLTRAERAFLTTGDAPYEEPRPWTPADHWFTKLFNRSLFLGFLFIAGYLFYATS